MSNHPFALKTRTSNDGRATTTAANEEADRLVFKPVEESFAKYPIAHG
jgi:hypothetical protein